MKNLIFIALLFSAHWMSATGNPGKATASIVGQVIESETTETLAGVRITINGTDMFTYTDKDGHFEFTNLPEGKIELSLSLVSFEKNTQELIAHANEKSEVIIPMTPR